MIKINVTDEQRTRIEECMKKIVQKHIIKIEELIELLEKENCKETANKLREETRENKLFLLYGKQSFKDTIEKFDKVIEMDNKINADVSKFVKHGQKEIIDKNSKLLKQEKIHGFFDLYKTFASSDEAYDILGILQVNVCPYCNRQFTYTVKKNKIKARPQFDHFFPKYINPYLAISIFNLVPSCGLCNQGKSNTDSDKFLYPYEESFEDKGIYFHMDVVPTLLNYNKNKNIVKLDSYQNQKDLIDQYNTSFKIELLYNEHAEYISELLDKNYIFNDDTIEMIYNSFDEVLVSQFSQSKLKQMILGNNESENFNQRPLSKLTSDILHQINDI